VITLDDWDPKLKNPESKVDRQIHVLNNDAYLADIFGRADDLLLFSLFANKGKKRRHHAVKPEPAQESKSSPISNDDGKAAAKICKRLLDGEVPCDEVLTEVKGAVLKLQDEIPVFKSDEARWAACLQQ
jgi:hypothetical protein